MSDINGKLYNKDRPHKINSKQGNRITTSIRENNCNMTWDKKVIIINVITERITNIIIHQDHLSSFLLA